jgi:hypothetical protein
VRRGTYGRKCLLRKGICVSAVAGRMDNLRARFPHDGAPAHFARAIRGHGRAFHDRWNFAGGGGFAWPSRSPELTPLDFFILEPPSRLICETCAETEDDLVA